MNMGIVRCLVIGMAQRFLSLSLSLSISLHNTHWEYNFVIALRLNTITSSSSSLLFSTLSLRQCRDANSPTGGIARVKGAGPFGGCPTTR